MNERFKVIITDYYNDQLLPERAVLDDIADLKALDAYSEEELVGQVEDADAIMCYHHLSITRKTLERLEKCRVIARSGVGYDNVDWPAARELGIPVCNVPDYGTEDVADSAMAHILSLGRGCSASNSMARAGVGPWTYEPVVPLHRLRGRTLAIVGLGRIGTAVAVRAKASGMDVVYYDPYKPEGYDKSLGIRMVRTLGELLSQASILTLHCPLSEETRHMIDASAIAAMPAGSYLVNTARGGIVDTLALAPALESGHLAGVAVDVLEQEPPDENHPLLQAWRDPNHRAHHRLIVNPHTAFYCEEGIHEMRTKGATACRCALLGQPIPNVVNG